MENEFVSRKTNEENLNRIEKYIRENPDCVLHKTHTVLLQGRNVDLPVYRFPINLLYFNIKNGRFAAEYIELRKKEGREITAEDTDDAKKIHKLLVDLDPKQSSILMEDLKKYGQREPGIISNDGYIINGNRRMAVLKSLYENGNDQFGYMLVARLPQNVTSQDLWKIEAGIQLSRRVQLDYGPINTLLKFKEGIDAGLTPSQIASSLYGGFTEDEILENLEQLKLIAKYANFIGEEGNYKSAEGVNEHFIDLRAILKKAKKDGYSPDEIMSLTRISFQLIHDGIPQRELRKIKDVLRHDKVTQKLFGAIEYAKPELKGEKLKKLKEAEIKEQITPARTIFVDCLDEVRAADESEEPTKLLQRAVTNLENINPENTALQSEEAQKLIDRINTLLIELKLHYK